MLRDTMDLHGKHLLAGDSSATGTTFFSGVDPTTGSELAPRYTEVTIPELDAAMAGAQTAFREMRETTGAQRAAFLRAVADAIEAIGDPLLERGSAETGLPLARLTMKRGRTCNQLRMFANLVEEGSWVEARIDLAQPDRVPLPKPDLRRMLVPLGPVAIFGASNFPLAFSVAGGDTASALAAGCPVVVKAHPNHPGTSEMVGRAIVSAAAESGMPAGTFSLIHGRETATGAALVQHPAVRAVGFTGSLAGGRALFDLAAARPEPIPVYAEMGSTNPVFVLPGAMAGDGAAKLGAGMTQSVTMGVGQFCTNPGIVVAMAGDATDQLQAAMAEGLGSAAPGTMLHAGIRDNYERGLSRWSQVEGVKRVARGPEPEAPNACAAQPAVHATTAATFLQHPAMAEEVFGPATLLVRCENESEMLAIAANVGGQLTATVHGTPEDLKAHGDLLAALQETAGRVVCNGFPTGVEVCPSMHHGGPYPASTDARTTSVGTAAIQRFARPVCLQDMPDELLPAAIQNANPLGLLRLVDGEWSREGSA